MIKLTKKSLAISTITVLLSVSVVFAVVKAATDLTVPGGALSSGSPIASMHTLEDIYHKLTNTALDPAHALAPEAEPAGTMHTLEQIYTAANDTDLVEGNIKNGVNLFGVTGTYTGALTWQTDPALSLCWSAGAYELANGCSAGVGLLDPTETGTPLLGAKEYCRYLSANGSTIAATIQDIWHLPTESELLAGLSDQFVISPAVQTGFQDNTGYWSESEYDESYAWSVAGSNGVGVGSNNGSKTNIIAVRCAR
jgi:hypothetical protein